MLLTYSMSALSILITSVLNFVSDRLVISISFNSFLKFCSVLSIGPYFFVSSIWQPPCVCFCILGRAALTPCLGPLTMLQGWKHQIFAMVGQPALLLYGGNRLKREQCYLLDSCSISSQFTHSLYETDTLLATIQSVWVCIQSRTVESFKWALLRDWQFLLPPQSPLLFIAISYEALFSWHCNPQLHGLAWVWDGLPPRCPFQFLSTTHECGTAHSASCC